MTCDKITPKKRLGQNFLINIKLTQKITSQIFRKYSNNVIEVGAGIGKITREIINNDNIKLFIVIEFDTKLKDILKNIVYIKAIKYKII